MADLKTSIVNFRKKVTTHITSLAQKFCLNKTVLSGLVFIKQLFKQCLNKNRIRRSMSCVLFQTSMSAFRTTASSFTNVSADKRVSTLTVLSAVNVQTTWSSSKFPRLTSWRAIVRKSQKHFEYLNLHVCVQSPICYLSRRSIQLWEYV